MDMAAGLQRNFAVGLVVVYLTRDDLIWRRLSSEMSIWVRGEAKRCKYVKSLQESFSPRTGTLKSRVET